MTLVYEECLVLIQYGARDGVAVRLPRHSLQYQLRIKLSQDTRTNYAINHGQVCGVKSNRPQQNTCSIPNSVVEEPPSTVQCSVTAEGGVTSFNDRLIGGSALEDRGRSSCSRDYNKAVLHVHTAKPNQTYYDCFVMFAHRSRREASWKHTP